MDVHVVLTLVVTAQKYIESDSAKILVGAHKIYKWRLTLSHQFHSFC